MTDPLAGDPVPLLAHAGALIANELALILGMRRQRVTGELITPVCLEQEGSDLTVQAFQVTNPFTGTFAGLTSERALSQRHCCEGCSDLSTTETSPQQRVTAITGAPDAQLLLGQGTVS